MRAAICGLAIGLAAAGCATLDKDECLSADWRTIGYQDGARGRLAEVIGAYRKDCAEHGVAPDLDAYLDGRERGLREYCREPNGYREGQKGKPYQGVCPADLAAAFETAFRAGRDIYELRQSVRGSEKNVDAAERELEAKREELETTEAELLSDGIGSKRRSELLQRTRELDDEIRLGEAELQRLRRELARETRRLDTALQHNPYP